MGGGGRDVKRFKRSRMSGLQRMNPTVFILGEEGPLYIISKGAVGGANGPSKYE